MIFLSSLFWNVYHWKRLLRVWGLVFYWCIKFSCVIANLLHSFPLPLLLLSMYSSRGILIIRYPGGFISNDTVISAWLNRKFTFANRPKGDCVMDIRVPSCEHIKPVCIGWRRMCIYIFRFHNYSSPSRSIPFPPKPPYQTTFYWLTSLIPYSSPALFAFTNYFPSVWFHYLFPAVDQWERMREKTLYLCYARSCGLL